MTAKKCFVFLGAPNSGKSMMLHLIESIFGEELISNIQLENLSSRFSVGILSTKRLNVCAELSARPLKNIEMFKLIVGGDTLSGEYKGKDMFRFKNKCKLLYAENMFPPIKNEDITTAFIDRLTVLRFNCSIPKNKRINNLDKLLIKEIDSIFSEAIRTVSAEKRNNRLKRAIEYITAPNKTCDELTGGIGANGKNALERMNIVKKYYNKCGGREYVHFVVSFKGSQDVNVVYNIGQWKWYIDMVKFGKWRELYSV